MSRRYIHPEQKRQVVTMSATMTTAEIARATELDPTTVRRVLRYWRENGEVTRPAAHPGRPRELSAREINVRVCGVRCLLLVLWVR